MLDRLKLRLEISNDEQDDLLEDIVQSATDLFLSLRYPVSDYPEDEYGDPVISRRWEDWILRCAIELYNKIGAEQQVTHIENGIHRTYDSGTISKSLMAEITPIVGIAR